MFLLLAIQDLAVLGLRRRHGYCEALRMGSTQQVVGLLLHLALIAALCGPATLMSPIFAGIHLCLLFALSGARALENRAAKLEAVSGRLRRYFKEEGAVPAIIGSSQLGSYLLTALAFMSASVGLFHRYFLAASATGTRDGIGILAVCLVLITAAGWLFLYLPNKNHAADLR